MMILIAIGEPIMIEGPMREEDIKKTMEGCQIEVMIKIEDLLEEEDPLMEVEDPLMMEDPLMTEDPLKMEDLLVTENPLEMDDILDILGERTTGPTRTPGPVRPIIVQQPQVTLDTTALENTFGIVGQSMLQFARAQDQTNGHLQQHLQQGQLNMQAHTVAL